MSSNFAEVFSLLQSPKNKLRYKFSILKRYPGIHGALVLNK